MRGQRIVIGWLLFLLLVLVGCQKEYFLRPPKPTEEIAGVPDEKRFTEPIQYPAEAMNRNAGKNKDPNNGAGVGGTNMRPPGMSSSSMPNR